MLTVNQLAGFGVSPAAGGTLGSVITGGTNFTNMNTGTLAQAFDGITSSVGPYTTTKPAYLGKTPTATKRVFKVVWWGAPGTGVIQDAHTGDTTIQIRGQDGGSAPVNTTEAAANGVQIGTTTFTDDNANTSHEITMTDNTTLYTHIWGIVTAPSDGSERRCSELQIYESV